MPRRSRPRDEPPAQRRRGGGPGPPADIADIEARLRGPISVAAEGYEVRQSVGDKRYRCPYCQGWIEPGITHLVAFRTGRPEDRRHYHAPCWAREAAGRR